MMNTLIKMRLPSYLKSKQSIVNFFLDKHGSIKLSPLLSYGPWKKNFEILLILCNCFVVTFMAASTAPAYETMSVEDSRTIAKISYLLLFKFMFWNFSTFICPLMNIYGRLLFQLLWVLPCCALKYLRKFLCDIFAADGHQDFGSMHDFSGGSCRFKYRADLSVAMKKGKKNSWWSVKQLFDCRITVVIIAATVTFRYKNIIIVEAP